MSRKRVNKRLRKAINDLEKANMNRYKSRGGLTPTRVHKDKRRKRRKRPSNDEME